MTLPPSARMACRLRTLLVLSCCALFAASARADAPSPPPAAKDKPAETVPKGKTRSLPPVELEKHYLVLIRRGPSWTAEQTPEVEALQQGHLEHLRRMMEAGKLVIAGPFDEMQDETLRGMCLYKTETREEARQLAEEDPAVKSGRLKVEVVAWYTEKGAMTFPKVKHTK